MLSAETAHADAARRPHHPPAARIRGARRNREAAREHQQAGRGGERAGSGRRQGAGREDAVPFRQSAPIRSWSRRCRSSRCCSISCATPSRRCRVASAKELLVRPSLPDEDKVEVSVADTGSGLFRGDRRAAVSAFRDDQAGRHGRRLVHLPAHHRGAWRGDVGRDRIPAAAPSSASPCGIGELKGSAMPE